MVLGSEAAAAPRPATTCRPDGAEQHHEQLSRDPDTGIGLPWEAQLALIKTCNLSIEKF